MWFDDFEAFAGLFGAPIPGENFYKANIKAGGER
jgi:hypothetical protein